MEIDVDELLSAPAVEAGVGALAELNTHHMADMSEPEREDAIRHWRELAVTVLAAARGALADPPPDGEGPGRAIIVLEDAPGGDGIAVQATFVPELDELADGEVSGTPAQITAITLLEALAEGEDEDDEELV